MTVSPTARSAARSAVGLPADQCTSCRQPRVSVCGVSPSPSSIAAAHRAWPFGESYIKICHSTDTPSPSILKHLLAGEGGCSEMTVSPTAKQAGRSLGASVPSISSASISTCPVPRVIGAITIAGSLYLPHRLLLRSNGSASILTGSAGSCSVQF